MSFKTKSILVFLAYAILLAWYATIATPAQTTGQLVSLLFGIFISRFFVKMLYGNLNDPKSRARYEHSIEPCITLCTGPLSLHTNLVFSIVC